MPKKKPPFEIVVGTSSKSPEAARNEAERKARIAKGEWISIAASEVSHSGVADATLAAMNRTLESMAQNIYTMAKCSCAGVGNEVVKQYLRPPKAMPPTVLPAPPTGGNFWVVYILLKH